MDRQRELHLIKTIPPETILEDLGIPFVRRTSYIEAQAVWRGEKRPSVSIQQNDLGEWLWHDFGSGKGGSWIDLVMELYGWDYITAVRFLRERYLRGEGRELTEREELSKRTTAKILEVKQVEHPALIGYLRERKIEKIPDWLRELHWETRGRRFFGVGAPTVSGTWTVRNRLGKWAVRESASQRHSYSLIQRGSSYLAVFEGLFDALSWEQLELRRTDILILNSVWNLSKALPVLERYDALILGLDNDETGSSARREIAERFGERALFLRFKGKDLNEALVKGERVELI